MCQVSDMCASIWKKIYIRPPPLPVQQKKPLSPYIFSIDCRRYNLRKPSKIRDYSHVQETQRWGSRKDSAGCMAPVTNHTIRDHYKNLTDDTHGCGRIRWPIPLQGSFTQPLLLQASKTHLKLDLRPGGKPQHWPLSLTEISLIASFPLQIITQLKEMS